MGQIAQSLAWGSLYLALVLAPLLLALSPPQPAAAGFWWDFAMALGYAGVAMLGVQFVLTARFKHACAPFGIDVVYYFHRYLALVLLVLTSVHVGIASVQNPDLVGPLDPRQAPLSMSLGRLSLLLLSTLIATSLWRKPLRLGYDHWRRLHVLLASAVLLLAAVHVTQAAQFLNSPGKRAIWLALTLGWLAALIKVRLLRPLALLRRPYRVAALHREPGRSWTLSLEPVGHLGFAYQPGQFAWLSLGCSPFALSEHPFSLASSPTRPGSLSFTIKALGDFTASIGQIEVGAIAYVDGPYGAFSCDRHPRAVGLVFVAGGAGIAPVMSMLRSLADRGDQRPLLLFYGNRRWQHTLFREELQSLSARLPLRVVHILGEPDPDWNGERGLLTPEIIARHLPANTLGWHGFICGPTPMIRIAEDSLRQLGLSACHIHSELFDLA